MLFAMKRLAALAISAGLMGCSYGPETAPPSVCARAHAERQNVPNLLARGSIASALATIDEANAACPDTRKESRGDEVKLLAELGRCDEVRKLADAIDADRDTTDGAWLAAIVARARCETEGASIPSATVLALQGRLDFEAGRLPAARRRFDRALAFAAKEGLEVRADCTHWSHKQRFVGAYSPATDALVVADGEHALVLSADDGRERLYLSGHRSAITHVAASADGRWILTASQDDVILWSTEDGTRFFQSAGTGPVAFSADGRRFAFVPGDRALALGRVGSPDVERLTMPAKVLGIALLSDRVAVSLTDETFRVLNDGGKERSRISHLPVRYVAPLGGEAFLLAGYPVNGGESGMMVRADVVGGGAARPVVDGLDEMLGADPLGKTVLASKDVEDGPSQSHTELVLRDVATGKDLRVRLAQGEGEGDVVVAGRRVFGFDDRDALHTFDAATQEDRAILTSLGAELRGISIPPRADSMLVTFLGPASLSGQSHREQLWLGGGVLPFPETAPYELHFAGDDRFLVGKTRDELQMFSARTGALWGQFPLVHGVATEGAHLSQSGRFVVLRWGQQQLRVDLEGTVPEGELPRPFVRFDGDRIVVARDDGEEAWLDPVSLRELRHAKPRGDDDESSVVRVCKNLLVQRDCVEVQYDKGAPPFTYVGADGAKVPVEAYPHSLADLELAPAYLAAAYKEGTIVFYGAHGGPALIYLRPFADGTGGYATTPDGRIELFGQAAKRAVCRVGALSLPFFACEERFGRTGLLASVMKTGLLPP